MKKPIILTAVVTVLGFVGALSAAPESNPVPATCCDCSACCNDASCCDGGVCCNDAACCDGGVCCTAQ